jgi:dimethylamine/trimethylamine dehydrogenase
MEADDIAAIEADHIVIATGAQWVRNGRGLYHSAGIAEFGPEQHIFTPDDIMAGKLPDGPTLIFDDDHYYMASVIAELLRENQIPVTLVTPENMVSAWGDNTSEQAQIHRRMVDVGVEIIMNHGLTSFDGSDAKLACTYTGKQKTIPVNNVVTVTMRDPNDHLYYQLQQLMETDAEFNPLSLSRIGDCEAPAIIAGAVFSGHRYARELDANVDPDNRIKYDRVFFEDD